MTLIDEAALARLIDQRVDARVRALGLEVHEYSSSSLPRGIRTRKAFARICRTLAGAVQDGPRGEWRVPRSVWHAARDRRAAPLLRVVPSGMSDAELALLALNGRRSA